MMLSPLMMEQDKTTVSPGTSRDGNFLGDLGKPTMRGIRKCTKCGLLNGTRGTRCKNTTCGMLFKSAEKLKPTGPEAVKLITDPGIQIYSVRTKTGDTRGFVQLPIVQDLDGNPAVVDVGIVCSAAKCYVETCGRAKNDGLDPCFHIRSSVEALEEASPLSFKNSILNSMPISGEMRQQIWAYATEKPGPLVQRVSKNIMVVKTAVTAKNPLGYLHYTFLPAKKDEKRFVCSCKESKMGRVTMSESESGTECVYRIQRCVHFYACVVAFASDEELSKEFKFAIDADNEILERPVVSGRVEIEASPLTQTENSVAIESVTESSSVLTECEKDLAGKTLIDPQGKTEEIIISTNDTGIEFVTTERSPGKRPHQQPYVVPFPGASKRFKPDSVIIKPQTDKNHRPFLSWLHFATERINASMHYSLPGNPRPLEFHIPMIYWDHLMQRMSPGAYGKNRLPNSSEMITRTGSPPLGTFNKYSWYITELSHLRKIFDTPEIALSVSKYYDRTPDGSYHLSMTPRVQVDAMNNPIGDQIGTTRSRDNHEYKTFLRVGKHGNQGLMSAFVIEWVPDIYPASGMGELTFTFQYSHMIDGLAPAVDDDLVHHVIETSTSPRQTQNIIIETSMAVNKHSQRNVIIEPSEWVIENNESV